MLALATPNTSQQAMEHLAHEWSKSYVIERSDLGSFYEDAYD